MNKIKCPHCNNISILNSNIKICVFKCPCCGNEVTANNCCNGNCTTTPNEVYAIVGEFIFKGGIKETRTIKLFRNKKDAEKYIDEYAVKYCSQLDIIKSFNYFDRTFDDYDGSVFTIVPMNIY